MAIVVIMATLFMFFDYRQSSLLTALRDNLTRATSTLQYGVNFLEKMRGTVVASFSRQEDLASENAHLKSEILLLNARVQRLRALEAENNQLHALLNASSKLGDKMVIAEILAIDTTFFRQEVIVSMGKNQGVYVGQAVLDAKGVVGQVVKVNTSTSRVLLITDRDSAVPVTLLRNGLRAIAAGNEDDLRLMHITGSMDVKVGDSLVTSGLGGHYPQGYPVGKVVSVEQEPGDWFVTVKVKPTAAVSSSRNVLLVWALEEKEHG